MPFPATQSRWICLSLKSISIKSICLSPIDSIQNKLKFILLRTQSSSSSSPFFCLSQTSSKHALPSTSVLPSWLISSSKSPLSSFSLLSIYLILCFLFVLTNCLPSTTNTATTTKTTTAPTTTTSTHALQQSNSYVNQSIDLLETASVFSPIELINASSFSSSGRQSISKSIELYINSQVRHYDQLIQQIDEITNGLKCNRRLLSVQPQTLLDHVHSLQRISLPVAANHLLQPQLKSHLQSFVARLQLFASLLSDFQGDTSQLEALLSTSIRQLRHDNVITARGALISSFRSTSSNSNHEATHFETSLFVQHWNGLPQATLRNVTLHTHLSWLRPNTEISSSPSSSSFLSIDRLLRFESLEVNANEWKLLSDLPVTWTNVMFDCRTSQWIVSLVAAIVESKPTESKDASSTSPTQEHTNTSQSVRLRLIGFLSVDVPLLSLDVDQCAHFSFSMHSKSIEPLWNQSFDSFDHENQVRLAVDLENGAWQFDSSARMRQVARLLSTSDDFESSWKQRLQVLGTKSTSNRLVLWLPETHKCHRASSRVSLFSNKIILKCQPNTSKSLFPAFLA